MTPQRIGIIGAGNRMRRVAERVLAAYPGAIEVAAVCDNSPRSIEAARASFPSARIDNVQADMLADPSLSWIFVGSFNGHHRDHALPALEAGKHVFCEKPLEVTVERCLDLRRAARRATTRFVIGFVLRYSPFYRKLKALLEEGAIGDIVSIEFNETLDPNHGAAMHGNWRRHRHLSGPFLLEKCCHDMDILHWIVGERPARVASFGGLTVFRAANAHLAEGHPPNAEGLPYYFEGTDTGRYVGNAHGNVTPFNDDKDVIDNQVAILEFPSGVRASFHLNAHAALKERRFYIVGTKGAMRGDLEDGVITLRRTGWDAPLERFETGIAGGFHGDGDGVLARELGECILHGTPLGTGIDEAIDAAVTSLAIDHARESGRVLNMNAYWARVGRKGTT